jgi:protease IV
VSAAADPSVRAVVLRVNSPGGTVTAADTMYQELMRFKAKTKKPVVASTQDLAASGGYYVALGADRIVAHPTSVVGSIGVLFQTFDFQDSLAKIGARAEAITSGPLKDMASPFRHLRDDDRQVIRAMVDDYHDRFKQVLRERRKIADEQTFATVTDGRVVSGTRAVQLGLADQTGLLADAIDQAKQLANLKDASVIMYKRPYGYSGSIYADAQVPAPQANVTQLQVPGISNALPGGFYYLWTP